MNCQEQQWLNVFQNNKNPHYFIKVTETKSSPVSSLCCSTGLWSQLGHCIVLLQQNLWRLTTGSTYLANTPSQHGAPHQQPHDWADQRWQFINSVQEKQQRQQGCWDGSKGNDGKERRIMWDIWAFGCYPKKAGNHCSRPPERVREETRKTGNKTYKTEKKIHENFIKAL